MNQIETAIDKLGGVNAASRALAVTPSTVSEWVKGKRPIPADKCVVLERITGVSRIDLYAGDGNALWPELSEKANAA